MIDATLCKVLLDCLIEQELVGREVTDHIQHASIWKRILVKIRSDGRMNRDVFGNDGAGSIAAGKNPVARVDVWNGGVDRSAERFSQ